MDPELILVLLVLLTSAPAAIVAGHAVRPWIPDIASARAMERLSWGRLWRPLLPAVAIGCAMVGWAIAEPVPADEPVTWIAVVAALPFALVWCRAIARAAWAWRPRGAPLAATVGLLRPTILLSPVLHDLLDADALTAVRAHERAHAVHRDPLRIWLAQVATDLQWPSPSAPSRLRDWRRALEMARDEEVCQQGTDGLALAAGILDVARLMEGASGAAATLIDDERSLEERIQRLLAPAPDDREPPRLVRAHILVLACLAAALVSGVEFGDPIVAALLHALA